ncbi:MAG: hypothetical protein H6755_05970 [Candidatus Omnitrophica bacterium]|nr:hypothetical protein [Candidatus Omnitrophota bacterium]MCB9747941.1 hypothetical protein [Candidatus Omnitrophota bacterium]
MSKIPNHIQILRYVAEQGIVTVADVMSKFARTGEGNAVRVSMNYTGISHHRYGKYKYGVWFVEDGDLFELLRSYYPKLPRFKVKGKNLLVKVEHSLGLNHIRNILEQSDRIKIVHWWSEEVIRALSFRDRGCIDSYKVPDAVFWRERKDGSLQKFYLEYERSLKTPIRYTRIFQYYAKREDVKDKNVIYICESDQIRDRLIKVEHQLVKGGRLKGVGLYFNFITLDEFNQAYALNKRRSDHEINEMV